MNENRRKSLEAIINHDSFITHSLWNMDKCCAIGYALYANDINFDNYHKSELQSGVSSSKDFWRIITGLEYDEISNIINLNDSKHIKELHEYCQNLLNS